MRCCDFESLSRYLDDIPRKQGELYAGLVLSSHTHANITVDYSDAVKMEGVKGYIGVKDVPGSNCTGECKLVLVMLLIPLRVHCHACL